jgi:hypothetical protein
MKQYFTSNRFAYGLVRVTDIIDGHTTIKFAFLQWIGNETTMMNKAKVSTFKGSLVEAFSPFHVDLTASELREVTDRIVQDKVSSASGSKVHVK